MSDEDVRDGLRDSFGDRLTAALGLRSRSDEPTESVVAVQAEPHRGRSTRLLLAGAVAAALVAASIALVAVGTHDGHGLRTVNPSNTPDEAPSTALSTSSTLAPKPTAEPKVEATVTAAGVGSLRFGIATAADVRKKVGAPDADVRGSFGMPNVPGYRALGYDCSSTKSSRGIHIGSYGSDAPPYCRTVYFINVGTSTLAGFETTATGYATARSTTVGMTEAAAQRRESQPAARGCFTGILIGHAAPDGSPEVFLFVGVNPTDRVAAIAADSSRNSVGVLFC